MCLIKEPRIDFVNRHPNSAQIFESFEVFFPRAPALAFYAF